MAITLDGSNANTNGLINTRTAQNSTSGTAIDFTSIPNWARRITVLFSGVSTSGTSSINVQVGSGSFATTGYNGSGSGVSATAASLGDTNGFALENQTGSAAFALHGILTLCHMGSNVWVAAGAFGHSGEAATRLAGGSISLAGALDRVRITSVNGTDTFDAGSINILYE